MNTVPTCLGGRGGGNDEHQPSTSWGNAKHYQPASGENDEHYPPTSGGNDEHCTHLPQEGLMNTILNYLRRE